MQKSKLLLIQNTRKGTFNILTVICLEKFFPSISSHKQTQEYVRIHSYHINLLQDSTFKYSQTKYNPPPPSSIDNKRNIIDRPTRDASSKGQTRAWVDRQTKKGHAVPKVYRRTTAAFLRARYLCTYSFGSDLICLKTSVFAYLRLVLGSQYGACS